MINIIVKNKYTRILLITLLIVTSGVSGAYAAVPDGEGLSLNQDQQNILNNMAVQACSSTGGGSADSAERNTESCRSAYRSKSSNQAAAVRIFNTCQSKKSDGGQYLTCIANETTAVISTQSNTSAQNTVTDTPKAIKSDCRGTDLDENNCGIIKYIKIAINTLSAVAGVVIVGSVIVGGIQYSMSADDPQAVAKSKSRIINALIALLMFVFGYGILNYLIPGGIL